MLLKSRQIQFRHVGFTILFRLFNHKPYGNMRPCGFFSTSKTGYWNRYENSNLICWYFTGWLIDIIECTHVAPVHIKFTSIHIRIKIYKMHLIDRTLETTTGKKNEKRIITFDSNGQVIRLFSNEWWVTALHLLVYKSCYGKRMLTNTVKYI